MNREKLEDGALALSGSLTNSIEMRKIDIVAIDGSMYELWTYLEASWGLYRSELRRANSYKKIHILRNI